VSFKVVIPSRLASVRLPEKPLQRLIDRPLVQHVYERAAASGADEVLIATESERVAAVCRDFGARAVLTSDTHRCGTERVAEVASKEGWSDDTIIVNVQGDEPLMPSMLVDQVAALIAASATPLATLAWPIANSAEMCDPNIVKVVVDQQGDALYFSRAPIPWNRDLPPTRDGAPLTLALRHIGLYAYRAGPLRALADAPPCELEDIEKLEQLRALYLGLRIRVGHAETLPGPGVDTEADLQRVARMMAGPGCLPQGAAKHGPKAGSER
jgi:3-deoxy-manno-octulosonate cytidylyltransferase (CMP-KDO synthetase)